MATNEYDAIVVGARCASSPTAMLLARKGHRVLLVDRDHFVSMMAGTLPVEAFFAAENVGRIMAAGGRLELA